MRRRKKADEKRGGAVTGMLTMDLINGMMDCK